LSSKATDHLYCENRDKWRRWLSDNGLKERKIWLLFYKKQSGKLSISYEEALDEALCFGWIDSIIKRIDDECYVRQFSRRNEKSNWSPKNKARIEFLIREDRMTEAGYESLRIAKQNGSWDRPDIRPTVPDTMPEEFKNALKKNNRAKQVYNELAPSHQKRYILWIAASKRPDTREKRVKEAVLLLEKNEKLGLK
jgi:uncharacterized protein YdeI (YjbR/CyaY-like superfamily)